MLSDEEIMELCCKLKDIGMILYEKKVIDADISEEYEKINEMKKIKEIYMKQLPKDETKENITSSMISNMDEDINHQIMTILEMSKKMIDEVMMQRIRGF